MKDEDILATVGATGPRRLIGVGTLGGLGVLVLWLAIVEPPAAMGWRIFLIVVGVAALWGAQIMWRATAARLILTETELRDSTGEVLATIDNIARVDRSAFAMKPSNGFLILLKQPAPRVWRPGLWWRTGRRVAVGGVTAARDTKPMADAMTLLVARRDGNFPE
ncbi:hypothetical protein [Salipiger sp.]|uniref:hypothetical protein n=1 Tax=Salipiger sp. TaxID=2078585 RepID=UPI003A977B20